MSARSVPSGMRPSLSHSRRPISEPPRRPATAILTPLAPAFIDRWMACFIAFLNAMRRLSWPAMFIATRYASSSGWRISLISSLSLRIVMSSWREAVYSLSSAYHFAVQVRETPSRKPYGWTLCPMSGLLVRDGDGDVGHGLVDREGPTLCPRLEPLDGRTLVGD